MQVHPVEVWDLVKNLNLGGRWEASDDHFLRFFAIFHDFLRFYDYKIKIETVKLSIHRSKKKLIENQSKGSYLKQ